jgi:hypothetical protein
MNPMKKVVFGGFCMIVGILLYWMFYSQNILNDNQFERILQLLLPLGIGILGLILGIKGLRKD